MLRACLWDFQANSGQFNNRLTYPIDFIAENETILFALLRNEFLQGYTLCCLLDNNNLIIVLFQFLNCLLRFFEIFPGYGVCRAQCCFMNFAMRWRAGDSCKENFFDQKSICCAKGRPNIMQASHII